MIRFRARLVAVVFALAIIGHPLATAREDAGQGPPILRRGDQLAETCPVVADTAQRGSLWIAVVTP